MSALMLRNCKPQVLNTGIIRQDNGMQEFKPTKGETDQCNVINFLAKQIATLSLKVSADAPRQGQKDLIATPCRPVAVAEFGFALSAPALKYALDSLCQGTLIAADAERHRHSASNPNCHAL